MKKIDACKLFDEELGHPKSVVGTIASDINKLAGNVFHRCPYNGQFRISNFTVPSHYLFSYPKGDFVIFFKVFDDFDKNAMEFKFFVTVTRINGTIL